MRIRIGDLLVKAGVITDMQLHTALQEQQQWGGKLGDILVRMEFLTEEVLVRALSKQTGIARADLGGEANQQALALIPAEVAEEFCVVPIGVKDDGRVIVVAMSDPMNISLTDHVRSLTGAKVEAQLAGASAIRNAISRWYRGAELRSEEDEGPAMRIVNNSGHSVETTSDAKARRSPPGRPVTGPQPSAEGEVRASAVDVLRSVEETQRRSVAALKAMVELLIEKGVFSRDEYLARVRR